MILERMGLRTQANRPRRGGNQSTSHTIRLDVFEQVFADSQQYLTKITTKAVKPAPVHEMGSIADVAALLDDIYG